MFPPEAESRETAMHDGTTVRGVFFQLVHALLDHADDCDGWARESRDGGWSTHQVIANTKAANDLRRLAADATNFALKAFDQDGTEAPSYGSPAQSPASGGNK